MVTFTELVKSGAVEPTYDGVRGLSNEERLDIAEVVELPYSEVCMHMRVAGQRRPVIALEHHMAWVLNEDGTTFSFPITRGEAGLR